ncbi:MAG: hypothetical protein HZC28_15740 [Spirochaetes bacterium]|nr:hypothetical protein [Spirochaetota bacterium]
MKRIGEMLVEAGVITQKDVEKALLQQQSMADKRPIGEILVSMKIITIETLIQYIDIQLREKLGS